jgi:uncharacterized membrane protein
VIDRPERAFLALALPLGVLLGVTVPPAAAPDEGFHLGRVWILADGNPGLLGEKAPPAPIPRAIPELYRAVNGDEFPPRPHPRPLHGWRALAGRPVDAAQPVNLRYAGSSPPLVYLPALAGVAAGRALGLPVGALFWLGRAGSLAAWIALTWLAIRICPVRRWTLALVALAPTSLAMAASVSADAMTNAVAWLFLALVARSAFAGERPLARRERVVLLAAAAGLGLVKSGTAALAPAVLAIPAARLGSRGRWLALAAGVACVALAPSLVWTRAVQGAAPPPAAPGADAAAQLAHVLADPFGFGRVLAATLGEGLGPWYRSFVGVLGLLIVPLPAAAYWLYGAGLAVATASDGPKPRALTPARRALLGAVFAGFVLATLVLGYLAWNPVGAPRVLGVQGRYFLPAAPLLFLALPSRASAPGPAARAALVALAAVCGLAAVGAVVRTYYVL